jgi:hypothetical protein
MHLVAIAAFNDDTALLCQEEQAATHVFCLRLGIERVQQLFQG